VKRSELESQLEEVVVESATMNRKDRDRLIENLVDYMVSELDVILDSEDDEEDDG